MQAMTLIVAAVGSLAIIASRPTRSMAPFVIALCWYPQYLTLKLGTVDFNVGRLLIMVLLARLFMVPSILANFRVHVLDFFVLLTYVARFIALTQTAPMDTMFEREMGTMFDTLLVYIAARLSIRSQEDFVDFCKKLLIAAVPLACLGFYQSVTGYNIFAFTKAFDAWNPHEQSFENRYGWYRADVSFNLHIAFGLFFTMMLAFALGIWNHVKWRRYQKAMCVALMVLGIFSSMSSGPLLASVVMIGLIILYPQRKNWLYFTTVLVLCVVAIEFYSNRHFPHVVGRFAFSANNVHYRIGLWEEAFGGGMKDHYTFGYGYVGLGPGNDNTHFEWEHHDFLNIYIAQMVRGGLLTLIPFFVMTMIPYFLMAKAIARAPTDKDRWLMWCLMAGYAGWHLGLMTVNLLSQTLPLFYIILGLMVNASAFYGQAPERGARRPVFLPVRRRSAG